MLTEVLQYAHFKNPKKPAHEVVLTYLREAVIFANLYGYGPGNKVGQPAHLRTCVLILGAMDIPEGAKASVSERLKEIKEKLSILCSEGELIDEIINSLS